MNDDIVAALERERLGGMPRWNPCPWWVEEAKRLLQAKDHSDVITLLQLPIETAPSGAQTPYAEGLTLTKEGLPKC